MATITGIIEGKTGNYFKLEDFGDDVFTIVESIDPAKTEVREEIVKNKEVKADGKTETTYFHISCRCGDITKDLSLTFTALKQFASVMPRGENWRGYQAKYLGSKGSGKNIKYNFQVLGKMSTDQMALIQETEPTVDDVLKSVIEQLRWAAKMFAGGLIPKQNVIQAAVTPANFQALKDKGLIVEEQQGFFKVT